MKRGLITLIIVMLAVLLIRSCAFVPCTIPFNGMENSLYQGDWVIANRWSYGLRLPFPSLFGYHRLAAQNAECGDIILFNNPAPIDRKTPIEQRELFISRCIGTPGDTLMLNRELVAASGLIISPDDKFLYAYPGEMDTLLLQAMQRVGIIDNPLMGYRQGCYVRSFSHYELYLIIQELEETPIPFTSLQTQTTDGLIPLTIPAQGQEVKIYPWNIKLICNTINLHEGKRASIKDNALLVNGKAITHYTFTKNYYWVASSHSVNICDSRLFGFVPEDHLIGKASLIWFSKDPTQPWNKGFRWERFFQTIIP